MYLARQTYSCFQNGSANPLQPPENHSSLFPAGKHKGLPPQRCTRLSFCSQTLPSHPMTMCLSESERPKRKVASCRELGLIGLTLRNLELPDLEWSLLTECPLYPRNWARCFHILCKVRVINPILHRKRLRLQNSHQLASNHRQLVAGLGLNAAPLTPSQESFPPQSPLASALLQGARLRPHFFLPHLPPSSRYRGQATHYFLPTCYLHHYPWMDANTRAPCGHPTPQPAP